MRAVPMRTVIDTNVLFEGVTQQGGDCGLLVEAWRVGLLQAWVSNTLALEYEDVCVGAQVVAVTLAGHRAVAGSLAEAGGVRENLLHLAAKFA